MTRVRSILVVALAGTAGCGASTGPATTDAGPVILLCGLSGVDCAMDFASRCASGSVAPVQLLGASDTLQVDFNGTQVAALQTDGTTSAILHRYDPEGAPRGQVSVGDYAELIDTESGFAVRARESSDPLDYFLRRFDETFTESSEHPLLNRQGSVVHHANQFTILDDLSLRVLSDSGALVSMRPKTWFGAPFRAAFSTGDFVFASDSGGVVGTAISAIDLGGDLAWESEVQVPPGASDAGPSVVPTVGGFLVYGSDFGPPWVAAYDAPGALRGPPVDLGAELGITATPTDVGFSLATHDADTIAVYTVPEIDGTRSLHTTSLDSLGHVTGPARTLLRSATLPVAGVKVIWGGYSFIVAFGAGGAVTGDDRGVYMLRVCP